MNSILVVSELFYPEGGGAEKATYLILKYLAERGFEITVLTSTKNPAKIPGIRYYVTPLLQHTNRLTKLAYLKLLVKDPTFVRLLREHSVLYIPLSAYPLIPTAKQRGLRVVVHLHNYMPVRYTSVKNFFEPDTVSILDEFELAVFHEYYVQKSLLRTLLMPLSFSVYFLNKRQLAEADKLICVSLRQADIVIKSNPHLINKVEVIYNPVPPELLNLEPRKELDNTPTFLYVGGENYIKGFHILLRTIKELGKQGIKARFILTNKYSRESMKILNTMSNEYKNLGIDVVGRVEYHELIKLHEKAWALVFPSIWEEPLPYAVVEAMALGTIPITSRVGGVPELLDDTMLKSFMYTPQNIVEIIEIIKKLSTFSSNEALSLSHKLRNIALKKFDINNISKKIVQIFSSY